MKRYDPSECNNTELYQICRRAGYPVTPSTSREQLIALIEGEIEPGFLVDLEKFEHPFDNWRLAISAFIQEHWKAIEAQLQCPAKSGDPRACFQCLDAQVATCIVQNPDSEERIREKLEQHANNSSK